MEGKDDAEKAHIMASGDAVFRAPGPVALDSAIKRNIPQASFASASTLSEHITPEFEAQAKYIIDALTKKAEATANAVEGKPAEKGELLLDPSDRIEGYKRYRRWVDDGLDMWKVSLRHVKSSDG
jgi:transcription initiation factor TFIID subunit 5